MNSSSGDFWYVKLTDGDVHRVTLDQLDEAFQAGHINGDTMVLAGDASEWTRLGALAGMDGDDEEEVSVETSAAEAPAQYIPQRPVPHYAQAPAAPRAPAMAAPVRSYIPQPMPQVAAPLAYAPRPIVPQMAVPSFRPGVPNTLRPISVDFSADDLDMMPRRRGGAKKAVAALLAVAALGGVAAFAVTTRPPWAQNLLDRLGVHAHSETVAAAAIVTPPPPAPAPAPAPPPPPPVAAAPVPAPPPGADSPLNPKFTDKNDKLTDDQKARLAEADKQHAKPRKGHAGPVSHGSSSKGKSTTFTTGGSKYDPLNSSI